MGCKAIRESWNRNNHELKGLNAKMRKVAKKWVFLSWPNMALTKSGFKTNLVSVWRQTVERRERERKEEEEAEEEEEGGAKIKQSQAPKRYGTTNLEYGSLVLFG